MSLLITQKTLSPTQGSAAQYSSCALDSYVEKSIYTISICTIDKTYGIMQHILLYGLAIGQNL